MNSKENALWSIRGFLRGLNTSNLNNDDIEPKLRKITLTKEQYESLVNYIDEALK